MLEEIRPSVVWAPQGRVVIVLASTISTVLVALQLHLRGHFCLLAFFLISKIVGWLWAGGALGVGVIAI